MLKKSKRRIQSHSGLVACGLMDTLQDIDTVGSNDNNKSKKRGKSVWRKMQKRRGRQALVPKDGSFISPAS